MLDLIFEENILTVPLFWMGCRQHRRMSKYMDAALQNSFIECNVMCPYRACSLFVPKKIKLISSRYADIIRETSLNKILMAHSQDEVEKSVDTVIKTLERHKIIGFIIFRFADNLAAAAVLDPVSQNSQQWSNIKMARTQFNRIRQQLTTTIK